MGRISIASLAVVALAAASLLYGYSRLQHPAFEPGPVVAAIQGSVPQAEKNQKGVTLAGTYIGLHNKALALKPDLIIWPETCFPDDWVEVAPGQTPSEEFAKEARACEKWFQQHPVGVPTLLGLNGLVWEDGRPWKYNSAVLLSPKGEFRGRYDKMHLVPFGEYVPLKETFPWMSTFTPYTHDYSCRPGNNWTQFHFPSASGRDYSFGSLICYEDSDPYLARQYAANEPVDFLVNISNDGWFDGTEEHEQHLAISRFRAIEARRPIVRSVNMGISAVIDSDGSVVALPAESWSASKKMEGIVTAAVPLDNRSSTYARLGDWVPAACWTVLLLGIAAGQFRRTGVAA